VAALALQMLSANLPIALVQEWWGDLKDEVEEMLEARKAAEMEPDIEF
jgi:hypothetical protein